MSQYDSDVRVLLNQATFSQHLQFKWCFHSEFTQLYIAGCIQCSFFQDNEEVVEGPEKMVTVPPNHYCVIRHPVIRDSAGEVVLESSGQVSLFI